MGNYWGAVSRFPAWHSNLLTLIITCALFRNGDGMDEETARIILNQKMGWIDWNNARNIPNWQGGRINLDGRFTTDELRAILALESAAR
jgi:hypothetical protein